MLLQPSIDFRLHEISFSFFHFQSAYVSRSEVYLLYTTYKGSFLILIFIFLIHAVICIFGVEHLIHLCLKKVLNICPQCHFLNCFGFVFVDLFFLLCFLPICPFSICCKAELVVLSSLNFCLSIKFLVSPSI